MAANDKRFTQVPPRATGDRIHMVHTAEIQFSGGYGQWKIGERYTIQGSGGPTMSVHVHGVQGSGSAGHLSVHYSKADKYNEIVPIAGQDIIDPDGVTVAGAVVSAYDVYIPANNIMGYDNPEYGMDVDITGSANVRFAEGLPQLDSWGKLRVSGATHIGDYVFGQEDVLTNNFSPSQLQGGSVTYNDNRNSVVIKVPGSSDPEHSPNTGFAACSSNLYHHYVAGSSHLYMGTARLNNTAGASGCVRNWGLFDASNGFMFRLDQNNNFHVVIRTATSGSVTETVVSQSDFNGDKVDGTGDSQATLDLSKNNIYWIDIQWHGAGRVRFGTYIDGARVVMHSYYHGNNYDVAMSQTASLPVCWSVKAITGPTDDTTIETWSASVWTESTIDLNEKGSASTYASPHTTVTANVSDNWQYIFSISPKVELPNGETNHTLYMPTSVSAYAFDAQGGTGGTGTGGIDAIIDLKAEINSVHYGHSFSPVAGSTVEVSTAGTSYQFGKVLLQEMFRGRYENETTDTFNNWQHGSVKNFADDGGTVTNNILSITTGNAGSPPVVTVAAGERLEVRDTVSAGPVEFPPNANEYNGRYEFYDMPSVPELSGQYVYVKPIAYNQFEIYTDSALTTGFTVTSTHTANQGYVKGFRGSRIIWSFFAKTRTALHSDVKLMITVNWKEIIQ